jgi:hypothetical protein
MKLVREVRSLALDGIRQEGHDASSLDLTAEHPLMLSAQTTHPPREDLAHAVHIAPKLLRARVGEGSVMLADLAPLARPAIHEFHA